MVLKYIYNVIDGTNKKGKLAFTKTRKLLHREKGVLM